MRDAARRHGAARLTPVWLLYPGRAPVDAFVDRTAIVMVEPGADASLAAHGTRLLRPLMPSIGLWLVEADGAGDGLDVAERLAPNGAPIPAVRRVFPNLYLRLEPRGTEPFTPNDPRYPGQWFWENLEMEKAWGLNRGDPGTTIVVIDTGCDGAHADLVDKLDPGLDVVDGDDDPTPVASEDGAAHGTECAGLVGAATNNGVGVAGGCPDCRVRCVRMLTDEPIPISANVEAFQFALETNAAVVSNSWGFADAIPVPAVLADAIENVFDTGRGGRGALVLFAAGNDDRELGDDELTAVRGVLCIGAINNFDDTTPFTNYGASVDLVAPTGTLTTDITGKAGDDPGDYTTLFGGTSSACPVAAGIAGLLASAAPDRTAAELYDVMIATARPAPYAVPDQKGHDPYYGYGIVDPVASLRDVLGLPDEEGPPDAGAGAGAGGAPNGAGGAAAPASDFEASQSESGCTCAAAGDSAAPFGAPSFAALALATWLYRAHERRRRAAMASAARAASP